MRPTICSDLFAERGSPWLSKAERRELRHLGQPKATRPRFERSGFVAPMVQKTERPYSALSIARQLIRNDLEAERKAGIELAALERELDLERPRVIPAPKPEKNDWDKAEIEASAAKAERDWQAFLEAERREAEARKAKRSR